MKIITRTFLFLAILLSSFSTNAQELLTTQATLPCLDKKFTIVAHIVRDSFGQTNILESDIIESMDTLNIFYSPICVSFEICEFNYIDNFQYDILESDRPEFEEMMVKYNKERRINMYFIAAQEDNPLCGFASLNGVAQAVGDVAIVILKSCVGPGFKTIPHEMGHFFNLEHTFAGAADPGAELVNGNNCDTAGDEVCDTPADPFVPGDDVALYVSTDPETPCRFISLKRDLNGEYFVPDVGNVMSYYPGSCSCGFTYDQYVRMANAYLSAPGNLW